MPHTTGERVNRALDRRYSLLAKDGNDVALVLALIHRSRFDPGSAVRLWAEAFDSGFAESKYDLCSFLIASLPELTIPEGVNKGIAHSRAAQLLAFRGRLRDALETSKLSAEELSGAINVDSASRTDLIELARANHLAGSLDIQLGPTRDSARFLECAARAVEKALAQYPEDVEAWRLQARVYREWADSFGIQFHTWFKRMDRPEPVQWFADGTIAGEGSTVFTQDYPGSADSRVKTLRVVHLISEGEPDLASKFYAKAMNALRRVNELSPNDPEAAALLAETLAISNAHGGVAKPGFLRVEEIDEKFVEALKKADWAGVHAEIQRKVESIRKQLAIIRGEVSGQTKNRLRKELQDAASTLDRIAEMESYLGRIGDARDDYERAKRTYEETLELVPDDAEGAKQRTEILERLTRIAEQSKQLK